MDLHIQVGVRVITQEDHVNDIVQLKHTIAAYSVGSVLGASVGYLTRATSWFRERARIDLLSTCLLLSCRCVRDRLSP